MKRAPIVLVMLALTARGDAQKPGPKVMKPEDIKDCSYWDMRIREAMALRVKYSAEAERNKVTLTDGHCMTTGCKSSDVGKTVDSNSTGVYRKATAAIDQAIQKYQAEKAKCVARQGSQFAAGADQQAFAKQIEALNKVLAAANNVARDMTRQNITALENAVKELAKTGYKGAGARTGLEHLGIASNLIDPAVLGDGWDDPDGAYYGHVWEKPPVTRTKDMTREQYCEAQSKVDEHNCNARINFYFRGPGKDTWTGIMVRRSYGCDPAEAYGRCDKWVREQHERCLHGIGVGGWYSSWGSPHLCDLGQTRYQRCGNTCEPLPRPGNPPITN